MSAGGLFVFSLIGVGVLVILARLLGFARQARVADAAMAARLAAAAMPGFLPADTALSRDGAGALVTARDGRVALVRPIGDRFVVRALHQPLVACAGPVLRVRPDEAMFPDTALDLGEAAAARWAARL